MHRVTGSYFARRGATLIEYAVLAGLIALALATAIMVAGQRSARTYDAGSNAETATEQPHLPVEGR